MAERPVFVANGHGPILVQEVPVQFSWNRGMAPSQKKKNVIALHQAAQAHGLNNILEISSKSECEVGQKLSAFNLKLEVEGKYLPLECIFQGSKVFENGGPFKDIFWRGSREAKRDPRLKEHGRLIGFQFRNQEFPLSPTTAFYDWIYINSLWPHVDWLNRLPRFDGFTDIEFNPKRSFNCQARSFATFVSLNNRGCLGEAVLSFECFKRILQGSGV
jgi:hypothetical protein